MKNTMNCPKCGKVHQMPKKTQGVKECSCKSKFRFELKRGGKVEIENI